MVRYFCMASLTFWLIWLSYLLRSLLLQKSIAAKTNSSEKSIIASNISFFYCLVDLQSIKSFSQAN